jgi:hypothetical protein
MSPAAKRGPPKAGLRRSTGGVHRQATDRLIEVRPGLDNIARGFGLRGHDIRDVSVVPKLFADFVAQGDSKTWNIQISDQVTAPVIRQIIKRGHGNM